MDNQTIIVVALIAIAIIFIIWRAYMALRRYSCCGTCGCDLMTRKERKVFEARKAELAEQLQKKTQG